MLKQELEILRSKYPTEFQEHGYLLAAINRYCSTLVSRAPEPVLVPVVESVPFEQKFEGGLTTYGLTIDDVIEQTIKSEHFDVIIRGIYKNGSYVNETDERQGYYVAVKGSRGGYGQHIVDTCYPSRVVAIGDALEVEVSVVINTFMRKVANIKYQLFSAPLSRVDGSGHLTELITMNDWLIFRDAKGVPLPPGQFALAASVTRYKLDALLSDISIAGPSVNNVKTCLSALQLNQLVFPIVKDTTLTIGCVTQPIDPTDLRVYTSMMDTKVVQLDTLTKPPYLK